MILPPFYVSTAAIYNGDHDLWIQTGVRSEPQMSRLDEVLNQSSSVVPTLPRPTFMVPGNGR